MGFEGENACFVGQTNSTVLQSLKILKNEIYSMRLLAFSSIALGLATWFAVPQAVAADETFTYQERKQARLDQVESEVERLLPLLTLDEKISLVHANSKFTIAAVERLGIHEMWMSDGPHGVRYEIERDSWEPAGLNNDQSTYLPALTSVASSWNTEMAKLHGDVLGAEARHRGKDLILGPGVNLARLPLYGRNFEYMGEDPILAAILATEEVKAIQAQDVSATVKHYALNTQEWNRTGVNATPSERTLREVYLPAFEATVKDGGALAIMGAYNEYYGTNANQSEHLVKNILKDEWGFKGVLITDWNVDINTYDAAMNGLDIEMGTHVESYDDYFLAEPLKKMVKEGKVPMAVLDDKVRRVLRVQLSIGMMDRYRLAGSRNTLEHHSKARRIAEQGIVLLKNDQNILPLQQEAVKTLLVVGPNADREHALGGGSSEVPALYEVTPLEGLRNKLGEQVNITYMRTRANTDLVPIAADYITTRHWTGTPAWFMEHSINGEKPEGSIDTLTNSEYQVTNPNQPEKITLMGDVRATASGTHRFQARASGGSFRVTVNDRELISFTSDDPATRDAEITMQAGQIANVQIDYEGAGSFVLGWETPDDLFTPLDTVLEAAKTADAVVYFGGLSHSDDREAIDRADMRLPNGQDAVIDRLLQANPETVVFLIAGSAVEMPWVEKAKTLVWSSYAGQEGGNAFADMLFGEVNPSGKLPITLPYKLEHNSAIATGDHRPDVNKYEEGVFIGYRWFDLKNIQPMFAFGHGLSYTDFEFTKLRLSRKTLKKDQTLQVKVTVKNTGKRAGGEVVQVYLHDKEASVQRPYKELKGFAKVFLQPGESKTVTVELDRRDLSFWDETSNGWLAEPGDFEVLVGNASDNILTRADFRLR